MIADLNGAEKGGVLMATAAPVFYGVIENLKEGGYEVYCGSGLRMSYR